MVRPLRLEYPGALYHVTSRGNARADIVLDDADREKFVRLLEDEVRQQGWRCYAWCLMDNHYHLLIETPEANLSRGMQRFNGRYTQAFNRRHHRVGHLFQGRYKAILVEKDAYLLELCRYIVLNPVRAGMVGAADAWRWSSHRELLSGREEGAWLASEMLLRLFSEQRVTAVQRYARFVAEGVEAGCPWEQLHGQTFIGGASFLAECRERIADLEFDRDIVFAQQHPERPDAEAVLADVARVFGVGRHEVLDRKLSRESYHTAVFLLRRVCNLSLKDVAEMAGISIGRVSQIQSAMAGKSLPAGLERYKV